MKAAAALRQAEKTFQAQVIQLAKLWRWECYHTFDSRRSEAGFPDLVMTRKGRMIVAELKVEDNDPTPKQLMWLAAFRAMGVPTYAWWPKDWPEIERVLG